MCLSKLLSSKLLLLLPLKSLMRKRKASKLLRKTLFSRRSNRSQQLQVPKQLHRRDSSNLRETLEVVLKQEEEEACNNSPGRDKPKLVALFISSARRVSEIHQLKLRETGQFLLSSARINSKSSIQFSQLSQACILLAVQFLSTIRTLIEQLKQDSRIYNHSMAQSTICRHLKTQFSRDLLRRTRLMCLQLRLLYQQ